MRAKRSTSILLLLLLLLLPLLALVYLRGYFERKTFEDFAVAPTFSLSPSLSFSVSTSRDFEKNTERSKAITAKSRLCDEIMFDHASRMISLRWGAVIYTRERFHLSIFFIFSFPSIFDLGGNEFQAERNPVFFGREQASQETRGTLRK